MGGLSLGGVEGSDAIIVPKRGQVGGHTLSPLAVAHVSLRSRSLSYLPPTFWDSLRALCSFLGREE